MKELKFPKLSQEKMIEKLEHPSGLTRIIIDTDTLFL